MDRGKKNSPLVKIAFTGILFLSTLGIVKGSYSKLNQLRSSHPNSTKSVYINQGHDNYAGGDDDFPQSYENVSQSYHSVREILNSAVYDPNDPNNIDSNDLKEIKKEFEKLKDEVRELRKENIQRLKPRKKRNINRESYRPPRVIEHRFNAPFAHKTPTQVFLSGQSSIAEMRQRFKGEQHYWMDQWYNDNLGWGEHWFIDERLKTDAGHGLHYEMNQGHHYCFEDFFKDFSKKKPFQIEKTPRIERYPAGLDNSLKSNEEDHNEIPEPITITLLGLGSLALLKKRK